MGAMQDFITSVLNNPHIQALEHATGQVTKPIQQAGQDVISGAMESPEQTNVRLNTAGFHMGMKDVGNEIANNPASEALGAGAHLVSQLPHLAQAAHGLPAIGAIGSLGMLGKDAKAGKTVAQDAKTATKSPVRITLKASPYGAGKESDVQSTVDNLVKGNTAAEKYNNLEPTMDTLGKQIEKILAGNRKFAGIGDIMKNYDTNLNKAGIYRTTNSPKDVIQKEAWGYINDLYNNAKGGKANPNPTHIADSDLYALKQSVNDDSGSIFKKINNGTTLTDREKVILAARQTIDDTLTELHPKIKDLSTQQSHLYDAADSLYNGREDEIKAAEKLANQPKLGIFDQIKAHPLGSAALALTGIEGVRGGKDVINAAGAGTQLASSTLSNMNKKPAMAQTPQAEPANSGQPRYTIQTPMDDGTLMSEQEYGNTQGQLQQKIKQEQLYDPQQANTDQGVYAKNKAAYDAQANIRKASLDNQQLVKSANNAYSSLQSAPINIMNVINQGYDAMAKANNGQYAKFAAELKYLNNLSGVDLTTAKSKEALQGAIDGIVEDQQAKLQAARSTFQGGAVQQKRMMQGNIPTPQPTASAPVNWQQNAPETNAILSQ